MPIAISARPGRLPGSSAIAEAITLLISDRERRERYARNGRAAIEGKYGWHKMEERLWELYERLEQRPR